MSMHRRLELLEEKGFCILQDYQGTMPDPSEWEGLEYMDWKSGGDTNFAPLASALGEMECHGFWEHGKSDKDGIWTKNIESCPTIKSYVESVHGRYGRVRIIKLNPSTEEEARKQIHLDDNNRLNPEDEGWVVRSWLELTDVPGTKFILRGEKDDPSTETQIPLHKGMQFVIDSERMWHVVHNVGPQPRYSLITSWESNDALEAWMRSQLPVTAGVR
ncbi:MAG: hypothetical protein ACP5OR_03325 [Candidatus Dormibacteria bacterium]